MTNFYRIAKTVIDLTTTPPTGLYSGRLTIENLRVSFAIQKNLAWSTNTCSLRIWNLSGDHRNLLKNYGDKVTFFAGFQQNLALPLTYTGNSQNTQLIFTGNSTNVRHAFEYPDIITTIEIGDGELFSNQKLIEVSYQAGTPAIQVIKNICLLTGLTLPSNAIIPNLTFETGRSYAGPAKDLLQQICQFLNVQWSIQNENLQIIPTNGAVIQPPHVLNADTGMVGVPERYTYKRLDLYRNGPKTGWRVRSTLRPEILPGSRVLLQSTQLNLSPSTFRVETVRHDGDTHGPSWFSNIEITEVAPI